MRALGERAVDGPLPAVLEGNPTDVWAALGQLPLRETLPLHARALFAPTMAEQAIASGSPANNPRVPVAAEIERLYGRVSETS